MLTRFAIFTLLCWIIACSPQNIEQAKETALPPSPYRIAFGSCSHQNDPQPILDTVLNYRPDLFIYLGDNIYGDTKNMDTLRYKYGLLAAKPEFQRLKGATRFLATWDDHDFGWNDSGRHYPFKEESKEIFLDFWEEPADSERRKHEGIYHVEWVETAGLKIQVILLDTRTFRDDLLLNNDTTQFKNDYRPNNSPDSTFLGEQQWTWLRTQFQQEADLRIMASSNQFSHEYNGWESWTNVPHEQQKMLDLIKETKANGVVFLSGDVHWGELSKLEEDGLYPIYDVTSSGLTSTWYNTEPNKNRVGEVIPENNFGLLEIEGGEEPILTMKLVDIKGKVRVSEKVIISKLSIR